MSARLRQSRSAVWRSASKSGDIKTAGREPTIIRPTIRGSATVIQPRAGEVLSSHDIDPARGYWRNKQKKPGPMARAYCHLRHDDTYELAAEARAGHVLSVQEPFPVSFDPVALTELD